MTNRELRGIMLKIIHLEKNGKKAMTVRDELALAAKTAEQLDMILCGSRDEVLKVIEGMMNEG